MHARVQAASGCLRQHILDALTRDLVADTLPSEAFLSRKDFAVVTVHQLFNTVIAWITINTTTITMPRRVLD